LHGESAHFVQGTADCLPFLDASFDLIFIHEVLEHVEDDLRVLREGWRTLRPGGRVFLVVPNKFWPFETHGFHLGKFQTTFPFVPFLSWAPNSIRTRLATARIYTRWQLLRLVETAGFIPIHTSYFWPHVDLRIGPLRNTRIRESLRRWSERLESSRLSPFGHSILVVAEKSEVQRA
jgi:ubiquinone/menaquinone biosynthesis C-methylase UbiE